MCCLVYRWEPVTYRNTHLQYTVLKELRHFESFFCNLQNYLQRERNPKIGKINTKMRRINKKGTRMVKDGED